MTRKEKYAQFLMHIVDASPKDYSMLFDKLLDVPFVYYIGNDVNRAEDGLDLRFQYEEEYGKVYELNDECSIIEAFIALSERCDKDIMYDSEYGNRTSEWFWMIMDNLKLSKYTNERFNEKKIDQICYVFNARKYNFDGSGGGAFPLQRHHLKNESDVRDVELWFQMNWYLIENYEI